MVDQSAQQSSKFFLILLCHEWACTWVLCQMDFPLLVSIESCKDAAHREWPLSLCMLHCSNVPKWHCLSLLNFSDGILDCHPLFPPHFWTWTLCSSHRSTSSSQDTLHHLYLHASSLSPCSSSSLPHPLSHLPSPLHTSFLALLRNHFLLKIFRDKWDRTVGFYSVLPSNHTNTLVGVRAFVNPAKWQILSTRASVWMFWI